MSSGAASVVTPDVDTTAARSIDEVLADRQLVQRTLRRGVRAAVLEHKRAGNPIATWRDGRVVWIPADEIVVHDEPE